MAVEATSSEAYFDISEIGHMKRVYRSGERIANADVVALTCTDILVLEPSALLADMEESLVIPCIQTRSKDSGKFSIKDLFHMSKLLRRTEVFQPLDCRALVDVCSNALHFETRAAGQWICREGQEATGFFEILAGTASSSSNRAFLFELKEGSAVGEDVLLEQEPQPWPFSVVAESAVELLWIDAKGFKECCLDLSGQRLARRRILEAADWREENEDLEAFVQTLKVPLLKNCDPELRFELLKQATITQIPAGGQVAEMLEGDLAPLYIILKGAVGRYAVDLPEETMEELGDSAVSMEHLEDAQRHKKEIAAKRRRLAKATEELRDLKSRHRREAPLDRPLQESLRVHFLTKLVAELSGELQSLPEADLPERKGEKLRDSGDGHATDSKVHTLGSAGVFLTSPVDHDLPEESDELEELLDKALVEHYEGDSFGWEATEAASYVAHQDTTLMVLQQSDLHRARELCEARQRQQRGHFLQRCLGDEDVATRLLPLFGEERGHRGSILVKAGSIATSLWLILSGSCSQVKEVESKETHGRFRRTSLGVLQEGQFVGLTSLLQQPEPLTVICATEVQLLRAEHLSHAKLTPKVIEALKSGLQQKGQWLSQRLETLAELPGKLDAKAERLRNELYEARVPLVSDSPFLRRKHQALLPGMVALEAVCKHFGNEVHPESEWIYMQKERDFFMHMQLSSGFSEPMPKADLAEHGTASLQCITSPATANARFGHHQSLLWKKLRMEPTEVQVWEKAALMPPGSPLALEGPEPPVRARPEELPIPSPEPVTPRMAAASPEEQFRRKPQIILRANSRVFQNCSTEVTMNERRAVKEAKAKLCNGAVVREPLVTPRDQGQCRSVAKRFQKGFSLTKSAKGATPPKSPSPSNPTPERITISEESLPLTAMTQLVPVTPVDPVRKRRSRRLLVSQQSRTSRTETEESSLSVDSRTWRSRQ